MSVSGFFPKMTRACSLMTASLSLWSKRFSAVVCRRVGEPDTFFAATRFTPKLRKSAIAMLSVKSPTTRFYSRRPLLKSAWRWFSKRAELGLLRAMQESRARSAARLFREYAHLIADGGKTAGDCPQPTSDIGE